MSQKVKWPCTFPERWEVLPSKRLFPESKERAAEDEEQLSATQDYGVIAQSEFMRLAGRRVVQLNRNLELRKRVEIGNFVISMRSFQGGLERAWASGGIRSSYVVLKPREDLDLGFYQKLFKSEDYIQTLQSTSNFIRDGQDLNYQNFVLIDLPLPPISEQRAIAAFLDYETARIDALIAEQERLIALLKEKRQAVISHAVTKGCDPSVPMKDSGVEWIGEVPQHWKVIKLGLLASEKCDGPFGSALKSEHYSDEGVRVIRLQNIKAGWFNNSNSAFIDNEYYKQNINKSDVQEGDLLIAGLGDDNNPVGRACVAPTDISPAMVKADCFRFRLLPDIAVPEFVADQLTVGSEADAGKLSTGSTRSRIPLTLTSARSIALPPVPEQLAIVQFIKGMTKEVDVLLNESRTAVLLLQERRSALISAAVTGKIDVRNWQPPTSTASTPTLEAVHH